jgi:hypothetical protein
MAAKYRPIKLDIENWIFDYELSEKIRIERFSKHTIKNSNSTHDKQALRKERVRWNVNAART